jgi:hypothetical protein
VLAKSVWRSPMNLAADLSGSSPDRRHAMPDIILAPRQIHLAPAIGLSRITRVARRAAASSLLINSGQSGAVSAIER